MSEKPLTGSKQVVYDLMFVMGICSLCSVYGPRELLNGSTKKIRNKRYVEKS